jgi:hypothetical protein
VTPDYIRAHRHCGQHRDEILASSECGCFYCCAIFPTSEIEEWVDDWDGIGQTAICPRCGIDAVIGSESGYPIDISFLTEMKQHWF